MKNKITLPLFACILFAGFALAQDFEEPKNKPQPTSAPKNTPVLSKMQQKRLSVQSGEIKLESEVKKKDPYETAVDAAFTYLNSIQTALKSASAGSASKTPLVSEDALQYLTTSYLYCSVNTGVCQYFLDTLFEADLINARLENKDACSNLRAFWKKYLENDLENRHKYATKIGFLADTGEFNTKTRPKYIKCVDTIKKERESSKNDSEFFKQRYANGAKLDAVNKTIEYLQTLKNKNINTFKEITNFR